MNEPTGWVHCFYFLSRLGFLHWWLAAAAALIFNILKVVFSPQSESIWNCHLPSVWRDSISLWFKTGLSQTITSFGVWPVPGTRGSIAFIARLIIKAQLISAAALRQIEAHRLWCFAEKLSVKMKASLKPPAFPRVYDVIRHAEPFL